MNYAGPIAAAEFRLVPALRFGLRSSWENAALALQLCWPWLAILSGLEIAAGLGAGYPLGLVLPGGVAPDRGGDAVLIGLLMVLKLVAVSSLAVSWSRFLLLGEIATGWDRLRVDRPVWRFACNAVLIWFACSGVFLLGSLITFVALPLLMQFSGMGVPAFPRAIPAASEWLANPWALIILSSLLLGVLGGLPVVQRLSIKLVAIATGREDYGLGDAWRDSGGQPLPLVIFTFAVTAIVVLVWAGALGLAWQMGSTTATGLIAAAAAAAAATGFSIILSTASLAVLFGLFVEGREV